MWALSAAGCWPAAEKRPAACKPLTGGGWGGLKQAWIHRPQRHTAAPQHTKMKKTNKHANINSQHPKTQSLYVPHMCKDTYMHRDPTCTCSCPWCGCHLVQVKCNIKSLFRYTVSVDANLAQHRPSLSSIPAPLPARAWFLSLDIMLEKWPQTHQEHYQVYYLRREKWLSTCFGRK